MKPQRRQHVFAAGDLDQFGNPADPADQGVVPFLEIDFWFGGGTRNGGYARKTLLIAGCELIGFLRRSDQRAECADHRQDAGDVALVEDMDGDAGANEIGNDIGLQIREGENEVRLERQDFRNIRRDERRHPRFLAPNLRRPNGIAGNADDTALFAEQIQRLHSFLGETYDPAGRELAHEGDMPNYRRVVTKAITRNIIAGLGNPSLQLTKIKMSFRGGAKSADR